MAFKHIEDANESQFTTLTKGKYFLRPRTKQLAIAKGKGHILGRCYFYYHEESDGGMKKLMNHL